MGWGYRFLAAGMCTPKAQKGDLSQFLHLWLFVSTKDTPTPQRLISQSILLKLLWVGGKPVDLRMYGCVKRMYSQWGWNEGYAENQKEITNRRVVTCWQQFPFLQSFSLAFVSFIEMAWRQNTIRDSSHQKLSHVSPLECRTHVSKHVLLAVNSELGGSWHGSFTSLERVRNRTLTFKSITRIWLR